MAPSTRLPTPIVLGNASASWYSQFNERLLRLFHFLDHVLNALLYPVHLPQLIACGLWIVLDPLHLLEHLPHLGARLLHLLPHLPVFLAHLLLGHLLIHLADLIHDPIHLLPHILEALHLLHAVLLFLLLLLHPLLLLSGLGREACVRT